MKKIISFCKNVMLDLLRIDYDVQKESFIRVFTLLILLIFGLGLYSLVIYGLPDVLFFGSCL